MSPVYKLKKKSFKSEFISYSVIIRSIEEMMDTLTALRFVLKIYRIVIMPKILI